MPIDGIANDTALGQLQTSMAIGESTGMPAVTWPFKHTTFKISKVPFWPHLVSSRPWPLTYPKIQSVHLWPNCTKAVNLVKLLQAVYEMLCKQTSTIWSHVHSLSDSPKTESLWQITASKGTKMPTDCSRTLIWKLTPPTFCFICRS